MTKAKRQLRAEAVERLKGLRYSCDSDVFRAVLGWGHEPHFGNEAQDAFIELLTDEDDMDNAECDHICPYNEPPEGDAVAILRKAASYDGDYSSSSEALRRLTDTTTVYRALEALADMVERDYVRREKLDAEIEARDACARHAANLQDEIDEWKAKAESHSNLEWLYGYDDELAGYIDSYVADEGYGYAETLGLAHKWLMAPHVDANDGKAAKRLISRLDAPKTGETAENDASKSEMRDFDDSREKLEADVADMAGAEPLYATIIVWLDRQDAITHAEVNHDAGIAAHEAGKILRERIDELEAERDELRAAIAERYMELPVDADGVPIHMGDSVEGELLDDSTVSGIVRAFHIYDDEPDSVYVKVNVQGGWTIKELRLTRCRHVKLRTLEDVLHDFWEEWESQPIGVEWGVRLERLRESEAKYADEIRAMFGGDAE